MCSSDLALPHGDGVVKLVILAGGTGTRISEETQVKPKPMVEIGGKPILWHIMKSYTAHGITDFVICCGYRGYVIKEWFANYSLHLSDVTFDLKNNGVGIGKTNSAGGKYQSQVDAVKQKIISGQVTPPDTVK